MSIFAVVEPNGVVSNIIVADQAFIDQLVEDISSEDVDTGDYHSGQTFPEISDLIDPKPAPGWIMKSDGTYLPPVEISSNVQQIPPDGVTAATVTYTDNRPNSPAEVDGTVNGDPVTVNLVNGTGSIQVASKTSNDQIDVTIGKIAISIEVTA